MKGGVSIFYSPESTFLCARNAPSDFIRNASAITSPFGLPDRPSSVLQQQLNLPAMRLLLRLEYEKLFGASEPTILFAIVIYIIYA